VAQAEKLKTKTNSKFFIETLLKFYRVRWKS